MPKLTPPPLHPCKHCGAQTPDPRRKYCDPCWARQRLKRCRPVVAVKPVPKPRPPCERCGEPTPYAGRKWCQSCLDAQRQRAEEVPGWREPPKPCGYTIEEMPACPHCHERSWELHRELEGFEAWCPCGYIAYETRALPFVWERQGQRPGIRGGLA